MATVQPQSTEFGFAFVAEDGMGRPSKATDRRLIRSRCMRGKNRKIGVPRRVVHGRTLPFTGIGRHEDHTKLEEDEDAVVNKLAALAEGVQLPALTGRAAPSDLGAMQMASEATVESKIRMFYFLRFFRHVIHPIEHFVDYDISATSWVRWVFSDPAYQQCCLFMYFATGDITQQRAPTPATLYHMQRTIRLLNESLSSPDRMVSVRDSTVAVVIILTIFSCMMGDGSGASAHVAGLQQIIRVRGGLHTFGSDAKLFMKLGRVDLVYALHTGSHGGHLFTYPAAYSPRYYDLGSPQVPMSCVDPSIFGNADPRIITLFREMQYYTTIINSAHVAKHRRPADEFHNSICSFQYRLLQLQGAFDHEDRLYDGRLSETLRLALLSVMATTFQFPGARGGYPYLTMRFRECCQQLVVWAHGPSRDLMRWLLIVGATTVFDVRSMNEQWMWERWRKDVDQVDWKVTRERLREIMWIDAMQDALGRDAFKQLNKYQMFIPV
ncbi:hypothetical protein BJX66DRAFT_330149 [Aspergillus keveii]|uniref:Uncharacterized protein n=1 Tax=Aspergillus keveii TaxID=714993 RepID=A0ABR4FLN3_9EURO